MMSEDNVERDSLAREHLSEEAQNVTDVVYEMSKFYSPTDASESYEEMSKLAFLIQP